MDYGNTKTPSMHARLGNASLSQLAFPEESDPNFPRNPNGTIQLLKKKKKKSVKMIQRIAEWEVRVRNILTHRGRHGLVD